MRTRTVIIRVRVGGILEGNPPMLSFSEMVTRPDSKRKLHSQMVQVVDTELMERLRREAHPGEEVDVVMKTRLASKEVSTMLKDFVVATVSIAV